MGIASKRKQLGLSQDALAKELGVDQSAVHNWERGKTMPAAKRLPALAKILNCSIEELFQEDAADNRKSIHCASVD